MTEIKGLSEGDIVALKGEDGEWLIESFIPQKSGEQEVCFYNVETGNFIQIELGAGIAKVDHVIRKSE